MYELLQTRHEKNSAPPHNREEFRIFVPGAIRRWDEVSFVVEAFLKARIPNKRLAIAGGGPILSGKYPQKYLRRLAVGSLPNVSVFGGRLSDPELCREIQAADILVAPRLWATNSGIPYVIWRLPWRGGGFRNRLRALRSPLKSFLSLMAANWPSNSKSLFSPYKKARKGIERNLLAGQ